MSSNGNRAQRIGIWVIAIVMTVGTIGSFLVIILSNNNAKIDQAQSAKDYAAYQQQQQAAAQSNADNSEGFGGYTSRQFDASSVSTLKVEVLKQGTGAAVNTTDTVTVSYFGWLSTGSIFDSSKKKDASADAPVSLSLGQVISGWTEGLNGVRVGSIVRLTIPAAKAYGATPSGVIPANSPLEFIVEIHSIDKASA